LSNETSGTRRRIERNGVGRWGPAVARQITNKLDVCPRNVYKLLKSMEICRELLRRLYEMREVRNVDDVKESDGRRHAQHASSRLIFDEFDGFSK